MSQPVGIRPDEYTSLWQRVPSWAISLVLHAGLFLFFVSTLRGCGGTSNGRLEEEFRSIGIVEVDHAVIDPVQKPTENPVDTPSEQPVDAIDDAPPEEIQLPDLAPPTIAPGPPPLPAPVVGSDDRPRTSQPGAAPLGSRGLGPGETAFMDIRDGGQRFVYVIDCSGSMVGKRIKFARSQLTQSLNVLDPSQEFQILFYNTRVVSLSLRRGERDRMYAATALNTSAALRAIQAVQPNEGTRHVPALERAIRMRPDVIFFLTDGHDSSPTVGQLRQLKELNGGVTRIHCIEFGQGDLLNPVTWLRAVARENGGRYKYVDVNRLK